MIFMSSFLYNVLVCRIHCTVFVWDTELSLMMMMRRRIMIITKGSTYAKALKHSQSHFTRAIGNMSDPQKDVQWGHWWQYLFGLSPYSCVRASSCVSRGKPHFFVPLVKWYPILLCFSLGFQCTDSPGNRLAKENCRKAMTSRAKAATSHFQKGLELSSEELCRCFVSFETELW